MKIPMELSATEAKKMKAQTQGFDLVRVLRVCFSTSHPHAFTVRDLFTNFQIKILSTIWSKKKKNSKSDQILLLFGLGFRVYCRVDSYIDVNFYQFVFLLLSLLVNLYHC